MGLLDAFFDDRFRKDMARGLLDAGNRGAVAGLLGGPVDLATMALRPLGYNVEQPVGGSEWIGQKMQNLGLVSEKRNPLAEALASFAGPMAAQQIAPRVFAAELRAMDNMAKPSPMNAATRGQAGAVVWHGSPHKFDKFDSSKIGTGEGAQAYGHGLYLAESPDVAKSYQTALSAERGFSFGGKTGLTRAEVQDMVNAKYGAGYLDGVIRPSGVADSFIDDMVTGTGRASGTYPRQYKPGSERAKLYDELRGQVTHADPGSLYKVDLPDDQIARMLDWDKPLSQQPEAVRVALKDFGLPPTATGKDAYNALSQQARDIAIMRGQNAQTTLGASQAGASNDLLGFGIPGIRYLDGGSRGAGQGSSNYVVFPGNEGLLSILERNGMPLK